ncbi:hypothetical protein ZWY2020_043367 [Hordeum vulgare]|nr:hypothetical protein ZWY2020_043367 [Hordeum vulgare]
MHHTPHVDLAFNSIEHLLRYMHANGESMFLIVVHLHIFNGQYHASYSSPREFVRCLGVFILLLMIVIALIAYVPPWGQMSFWGAIVIRSLASIVQVGGDTIVTWFGLVCLLHHLLPLILVGTSLLHLAALHQYRSNNPLGVHSEMDKIASYTYLYVKDLVGRVASHLDNNMCANPMPTMPHIVPEWYFLPIHAILQSILDKAGGVTAIASVFISLLALPFLKKCWIGCQVVEAPFVTIGQIPSIFLFLFFAITPIPGRVGRGIPKYYTDETHRFWILSR